MFGTLESMETNVPFRSTMTRSYLVFLPLEALSIRYALASGYRSYSNLPGFGMKQLVFPPSTRTTPRNRFGLAKKVAGMREPSKRIYAALLNEL
jgi:hypothetical protein